MYKFLFLLFSFFVFSNLHAQDDPVLFSVEGNQVHVSEFNYIYSKNSGKDTDYSEESLREYLDLYVKFKLKVQRAKELKLDTIPALQKELEGYRKQLAKSYLTDKEVTNRLIDEVYQRSSKDIRVSHILFTLPNQPNQDQIANARKKAAEVKAKIADGMAFETAVKQFSEDKGSKNSGGKLPYFTSMFPAGFYELENTAYSLKKGEISDPIQTKLGIHIVRVEDIREARGEMEVSHILIRKASQRKTPSSPKAKIDSLYMVLEGGADFADVARKYSQDKASAKNGGYIGYFGINRFETAFEEAAYSVKNDGEYSAPVESTAGFHIIKRLSKKATPSYEDAKKMLKSQVLKDPRHQQATLTLIDRIKEGASFTEEKGALKDFTEKLDKTFFSYKWKMPESDKEKLFSFGKKTFFVSDFANFAKENTRTRLRMEELPINEAVAKLYKEYVDDTAIAYEEKQLEKKYPDFKAIMREYEEGILLFEVTKMNVWDKASQDTTGLKKFYEGRKSDYMWKDRARVQNFVLNSTDEKLIKKFTKKAKRKSPEWLKKKFGDIFTITDGVYERGSRDLSGIKFSKKAISSPIVDTRKGVTKFKKIIEIIPPALKNLSEARGYIEADYQDELEKQWITELKKKYKIDIDRDVLQSLVK